MRKSHIEELVSSLNSALHTEERLCSLAYEVDCPLAKMRDSLREVIILFQAYAHSLSDTNEASLPNLLEFIESDLLTTVRYRMSFEIVLSHQFPPSLGVLFKPFFNTIDRAALTHFVMPKFKDERLYYFIKIYFGSIEAYFQHPMAQQQFALGLLDANLFLSAAAADYAGQECFDYLLAHPWCSAYGLNSATEPLELVITSSSLNAPLKTIRLEQVRQQQRREDALPTHYWGLNLKKMGDKTISAPLALKPVTDPIPIWGSMGERVDKEAVTRFYQLLAWLWENPPFVRSDRLRSYFSALELLKNNPSFRRNTLFHNVLGALERFTRTLNDYLQEQGKDPSLREEELTVVLLTDTHQLSACSLGVSSYLTSATLALNTRMRQMNAIVAAVDRLAPELFGLLDIPSTMQVHFSKDQLLRLIGIKTTIEFDAHRIRIPKAILQSFANKIMSHLVLNDTLFSDSKPLLETPTLIRERTRSGQTISISLILASLESDWLSLYSAGISTQPMTNSSVDKCKEVIQLITSLDGAGINALFSEEDKTYTLEEVKLKDRVRMQADLGVSYRKALVNNEIALFIPKHVNETKEKLWTLLTTPPAAYNPEQISLWRTMMQEPNGLYLLQAAVEERTPEARRSITLEHLHYMEPTCTSSLFEALLSDPFLAQWVFGQKLEWGADGLFPAPTDSPFAHLIDDLFSPTDAAVELWLEEAHIQPGRLFLFLLLYISPYRSMFDDARLALFPLVIDFLKGSMWNKYDSLLLVLHDMSHSSIREHQAAAQNLLAYYCRKQSALQLWDSYWTTACYLNPLPNEFLEFNSSAHLMSLTSADNARAALLIHQNVASLRARVAEALIRLNAGAHRDALFTIIDGLELPSRRREHLLAGAAGAGAAITAPADRMALYTAIYRGDRTAVASLLAAPDVDVHTGIGSTELTPVQVAAVRGHTEIAQMLLDKGALIPNCMHWLAGEERAVIAPVFAALSAYEQYHARIVKHHPPSALFPLHQTHSAFQRLISRLGQNKANEALFATRDNVVYLVEWRWDEAFARELLHRLLANSAYHTCFDSSQGVEFLARMLKTQNAVIKRHTLAALTCIEQEDSLLARLVVPKLITMRPGLAAELYPLLLCILAASKTDVGRAAFLTDPEALPVLARMLNPEHEAGMMHQAARALALLTQHASIRDLAFISALIPMLVAKLHVGDKLSQQYSAEALAALSEQSVRHPELIAAHALESLIAALDTPHAATQTHALKALASLAQQEEVAALMASMSLLPKLAALLKGENNLLRYAAATCVARLALHTTVRDPLKTTARLVPRVQSLIEEETPQLDAARALSLLNVEGAFSSRNGVRHLVYLFGLEDYQALAAPILFQFIIHPGHEDYFNSIEATMILLSLLSAESPVLISGIIRILSVLRESEQAKDLLIEHASLIVPPLVSVLSACDIEQRAPIINLLHFLMSTIMRRSDSARFDALFYNPSFCRQIAQIIPDSPLIVQKNIVDMFFIFTRNRREVASVCIMRDGVANILLGLLEHADESILMSLFSLIGSLSRSERFDLNLINFYPNIMLQCVKLIGNTSSTVSGSAMAIIELLLAKGHRELLTAAVAGELINHCARNFSSINTTLKDTLHLLANNPSYKPVFRSKEGLIVLARSASFIPRNKYAALLLELIQEQTEIYPLCASPWVIDVLSNAYYTGTNAAERHLIGQFIVGLYELNQDLFAVAGSQKAFLLLLELGNETLHYRIVHALHCALSDHSDHSTVVHALDRLVALMRTKEQLALLIATGGVAPIIALLGIEEESVKNKVLGLLKRIIDYRDFDEVWLSEPVLAALNLVLAIDPLSTLQLLLDLAPCQNMQEPIFLICDVISKLFTFLEQEHLSDATKAACAMILIKLSKQTALVSRLMRDLLRSGALSLPQQASVGTPSSGAGSARQLQDVLRPLLERDHLWANYCGLAVLFGLHSPEEKVCVRALLPYLQAIQREELPRPRSIEFQAELSHLLDKFNLIWPDLAEERVLSYWGARSTAPAPGPTYAILPPRLFAGGAAVGGTPPPGSNPPAVRRP